MVSSARSVGTCAQRALVKSAMALSTAGPSGRYRGQQPRQRMTTRHKQPQDFAGRWPFAGDLQNLDLPPDGRAGLKRLADVPAPDLSAAWMVAKTVRTGCGALSDGDDGFLAGDVGARAAIFSKSSAARGIRAAVWALRRWTYATARHSRNSTWPISVRL
jgi:hypothetical protein